MKNKIDDLFAAFPLFQSATEESRQAMREQVEVKTLQKGEVIYEYAEKAEYVYFLLEGSVKIQNYSIKGHCIHIRDCKVGEYFGYVAELEDVKRVTTAVAYQMGTVGRLHVKDFIDIFTHDACLAHDLIKKLNHHIAEHIMARTGLQTLRSYEHIMMDILIRRSQQADGDAIKVPTRTAWATALGISRETLSRALSKMQKNKLIRAEDNTLHILDVEAMEAQSGYV